MDCDGEQGISDYAALLYTTIPLYNNIPSLLGAVLPEKPQQPTLAKLHKERREYKWQSSGRQISNDSRIQHKGSKIKAQSGPKLRDIRVSPIYSLYSSTLDNIHTHPISPSTVYILYMSKHIRYIKVQDFFFFLVFLLDQNFHLYSRRQILSAKEYPTFPFLFYFLTLLFSFIFLFRQVLSCLCTHPALLTPEKKKKNKVASTSFQLYGGACVCVCVVC